MGSRKKISRIDYSQFLLSSQTNYTLTYFAKYAQKVGHDTINRYLSVEKFTPSLLWEHVSGDIIQSTNAYLIFDDTVLDKSSSKNIEVARWQYSGNVGKVVQGIGVVTCIYYNPELNRYWAIDYRLFIPEQDGKSKVDHVEEMINSAFYAKKLPFNMFLMDTWYASNRLIMLIHKIGKKFYCPVKKNRLITRVEKRYNYLRADQIEWTKSELSKGITVHLHKTSTLFHVQMFRIAVSSHRTDFVITNDISQCNAKAAQKEYCLRWIIETFYREIKAVTGIDKCQCRKQRIQ